MNMQYLECLKDILATIPMLSRPIEEIGFGLNAEMDAQYNLSFKHLDDLKKVMPFEMNLMNVLKNIPDFSYTDSGPSIEKLNSLPDFEIPEIPDEYKNRDPMLIKIAVMKAMNLFKKLLAGCKDKSKVTTSFFAKNSFLVTADLTAKEWAPFAKLAMNAMIEVSGLSREFSAESIQKDIRGIKKYDEMKTRFERSDSINSVVISSPDEDKFAS
jgi:hypothetical protein